MPNLYDWKKPTVPVTVHLTDEAAKILLDYAGERSRGRFLSALLVAQRRQDDLEGARIAALEAGRAAGEGTPTAQRALSRQPGPSVQPARSPGKSRKGRKNG